MNTRRSGVTLVETLVVIGVISTLLAVLIPAVQHARQSARRVTCQNNLRQIVHGIVNHESTQRALPALYNGTFLAQPRYALDEFHFHSWRTVILPHIEQSALFNRIDQPLAATNPANQANINTPIATFVCPSSSNPTSVVPDIFEFNAGKVPLPKAGTAARSDYEAIGGVAFKPYGTVDLQNVHFGAWGEPKSYVQTPIKYRTPRLADISDGQSNTILVAERAGRPDWYRRGQPVDPYPYSKPGTGMDQHQATWGVSTHFWWLVLWHKHSINESNSNGIYSFHPPGANVGLADGGVRFLSESIDQETLNALATRATGDVVAME